MADRELKVIITGDASSLQRAMGKASKTGSGLSRSLRNLGKVAAVGVGAAFVGLAATLKVGFGEMEDGQKVAAQTAAVLKSTGGTANVTAKGVDNLATSLSLMSGVDDEVIGAGENMLLTFTNIHNEVGKGNDVFNQATASLLDMSTALGTDMNKSAIQLGKALNDPIKGITALTRVGVTFTAGQKEQIKAMVDSGNTMGAQKLILAELNKEFGGSAKAFGETLPGQVDKLKNSFSEMSGAIVTQLLPYFQQFLDWTNRNMPTIQKIIAGTMTAIIATINFLAPIIARLIAWFQQLSDAAHRYWPMVQEAAQRVVRWYQGTLGPAIQNVLTAIQAFWDRFGKAITRIATVYLGLVFTVVKTILGNIASFFNVIMAVLRGDWGKAWEELKEIPKRTLTAVATVLRGFAQIAYAAAIAIGKAIIDGVVAGLSGLLGAVKDKIVNGIKGAISAAGGILHGSGPFQFTNKAVGEPLAQGVIEGWVTGSASLPAKMSDSVRTAVQAAAQAVSDAKGIFASAFDELTSSALAAFDKLSSDFETKTEAKIRRQDENRAKKERQQALKDAQAAVAAAQATLAATPAFTVQGDVSVANPDFEAAKKAAVDAQQQLADAKFAIQRAADEKEAEQERAAYEAKRERQRYNLQQRLDALQKNFIQGEITTQQFNQRLINILGKAEVPLKNAALKFGLALGAGLRDAFDDVRAAARALAKEIEDAIGNLSIHVSVGVSRSDAPDHKQHGGHVRRGVPYLVGEKGAEMFIPSASGRIIPNNRLGGTSGATGGTVIFNFPNYVGSRSELQQAMQSAVADWGRRNSGQFFAGRA